MSEGDCKFNCRKKLEDAFIAGIDYALSYRHLDTADDSEAFKEWIDDNKE